GEQAFGAQGAIDLVGGDVQEAERVPAVLRESAPVVAGSFQQCQRANHVGLDEGGRAVDRAVDVALGGEVQDRVRLVFGQQPPNQITVTDVPLDEDVIRAVPYRCQAVEIAGI